MAEDKPKLTILPFSINVEANKALIEKLLSNMLITRISQSKVYNLFISKDKKVYTDSLALNLGKNNNSDYVLLGSISGFGNSYSLDAKLLTIKSNKKPYIFSKFTTSKDQVIPVIDELARNIINFAGSGSANKLFPENLNQTNNNTPFINYNQTSILDHNIIGMAHIDIDGDKKSEILLINSNTVFLYKLVNEKLLETGKFKGESSHEFKTIDAADLDSDGLPEIFVTAFNTLTKKPESYILRWTDSKFKIIKEKQAIYFRIIETPIGNALIGQKRGVNSFFKKSILELDWQKDQYSLIRKLDIADNLNFTSFNLARITGKGIDCISISKSKKLEIYNHSGDFLWKSEEHFGESANSMFASFSQQMHNKQKKHVFLNQRIILKDFNNNEKDEVIVVKQNTSVTGRLFSKIRTFTSGCVTAFEWNGIAFEPAWKTNKIGGYLTDYGIFDIDGDGVQEIVVAVVLSQGFMKKFRSTIVYF